MSKESATPDLMERVRRQFEAANRRDLDCATNDFDPDAAERLAQERGWAMSPENVETVERAIAAVNARDIDGYLACCTESVELLTPLAPSGLSMRGPTRSGGSSPTSRT